MKCLNQRIIKTILPVIIVGLSIFSTESLAKNIKRSCSASYSASVSTIKYEGKNIGMPYDVVQVGNISEEFSAQGGCGKLVPNRCRKRARDKLLACARAHVKSPNQLPAACNTSKVTKYPGANLNSIIKAKACKSDLGTQNMLRIKRFLPSQYQLEVILRVHVRGSDDCGIKKPGRVMVDGQRLKRNGNKLFISEPLKHFTVSCP